MQPYQYAETVRDREMGGMGGGGGGSVTCYQ